jgi:hypothetical protein
VNGVALTSQAAFEGASGCGVVFNQEQNFWHVFVSRKDERPGRRDYQAW